MRCRSRRGANTESVFQKRTSMDLITVRCDGERFSFRALVLASIMSTAGEPPKQSGETGNVNLSKRLEHSVLIGESARSDVGRSTLYRPNEDR